MDAQELVVIIEGVLARAPEWLRHELAAKEATSRARAEETLAAKIAESLLQHVSPAGDPPEE